MELWEMLQLDYVRSYLLAWSEGDWKGLSHTKDRLNKADTELFDVLESVAPECREDGKIFDAVLEHSVTYADAYLSTGIIMGMKLQEALEKAKQEEGTVKIEDLVEKLNKSFCSIVS